MKERPILFSGEMVRAILEGKKTQTRRVIKVQPVDVSCRLAQCISSTDKKDEGRFHWVKGSAGSYEATDGRYFPQPFGFLGDRLWVREKWAKVPSSAYAHSTGIIQTLDPKERDWAVIYRENFDRAEGGIRWKPSIHMPRWASRINLEIVKVRVERLQDISESDAKAEGAPKVGGRRVYPSSQAAEVLSHYKGFQELWESINGKDQAKRWDANPWVWVVEFKRVEKSEAA